MVIFPFYLLIADFQWIGLRENLQETPYPMVKTMVSCRFSRENQSIADFPMVLLIMIPTKWLFHWGYTPFSDIPMKVYSH